MRGDDHLLSEATHHAGSASRVLPPPERGHHRERNRRRFMALTLFLEILILGALYLFSARFIEKNLEQDIQEHMQAIARHAAGHIDPIGLRLIFSEKDFFFQELRRELREIEKAFGLREGLVYIVELKEGKPVFSVMTNRKPFRGHPYPPEIAHRIYQAYQGREIVTDLYRDRHGEFISVLVPLYLEGEVAGVLEVDFPGQAYRDKVRARTIPFLAGLSGLMLLGLGVIFVILMKLHRAREEELKQTQLQIIQTEKMNLLSRLVAGIAHEINNPIGAINSSVDIVNRCIGRLEAWIQGSNGAPPENQKPQMLQTLRLLEANSRVIASAEERIYAIVRNLRNFAHLDEAEFKQTDIHQGLESTLALLTHEFGERIQIIRNYGEVPPIYGYPVQLNQVFLSMLINAAEAIPGEGVITITTRADAHQVYISIADTGQGIPPEKMRTLFDVTFTRKSSRMHLGMGLYNACQVIERHRGKIEVRSEVGKGTEFIIILPRELSPEEEKGE